MNQEKFDQGLFESLEAHGDKITPECKAKIITRLNQILNYEPKVGIFGKTGVGKSSLCNAVFGRDVCKISDIKACTREPQEVFLSIGNKGIKLLDVPGVGENEEHDIEYTKLYKKLLPELDLILWVLKGDDRAFSTDQSFYKKLVRPYIQAGKPFFIVINQVDKIEPFRDWDVPNRVPGEKQAQNIADKQKAVSEYFELPITQVLAVSANEKYNLVAFVDAIIHALPKDKKAIVLEEIVEENISESAKEEAKRGFFDTVIEVLESILTPIAEVAIKIVTEAITKNIGRFFKSLFTRK